MAIIAFVTGILFYFFFTRPWDAQEEQMNMLEESKYRGTRLGFDEEKVHDLTHVDAPNAAPGTTTTPAPTKEVQ